MLMKKTIKKMLTKNNDEENVDEKNDDLAKNAKSWQFLPAASNRPLAAQS